MRGPAPVTVRTHHLALGDLREDSVPIAVPDPICDIERLIALVIKLQNNQIVLSAVNAGMAFQELDQEADSFVEDATPPGRSVVDVALFVVPVVFAFVDRPTASTVIIELTLGFAAPRELTQRLCLLTPAARTRGRGIGHGLMVRRGCDRFRSIDPLV
jgi:hypothetical protein